MAAIEVTEYVYNTVESVVATYVDTLLLNISQLPWIITVKLSQCTF